MALYIFILYSDDDLALKRVKAEYGDDLDALAAAENLAALCKVDVWSGERLVAQIKKGNEPLNVNNGHLG